MTIQDLGSVGEVVAAIATVITLLYLAAQIRQNTRVVQGSVVQGMTETHQFELHWAQEIGAIFTKSIEHPDQLTSAEAFTLTAWLNAAFAVRQNEFFQYRMGLLDPELWGESQRITQAMLSNPWTKNWWAVVGRRIRTPAFVSHIESLPDLEVPYGIDLLDALKSGGTQRTSCAAPSAAQQGAAADEPQRVPIDP